MCKRKMRKMLSIPCRKYARRPSSGPSYTKVQPTAGALLSIGDIMTLCSCSLLLAEALECLGCVPPSEMLQ
jgi:hypothetical protein